MPLLATTQIPKPSEDQAFERASIVLWSCLLGDPNVQRYGRSGQRQKGVDLVGIRNSDPAYLVGIQCKLKGADHSLTKKEVRDEVDKALTFRPELREYFIITTAPDDARLQQLAHELTIALAKKGRQLVIRVWGWNTLEEKIFEHPKAREAFDPEYSPYTQQIFEQLQESGRQQTADIKACFETGLSTITNSLTRIEATSGDATVASNVLETHLDEEIDGLRELISNGKPRIALPLFERLLAGTEGTATGRILFRIKANIGICLLGLGEDERAAQLLSEAYDHAPTEPKAIANKALSLLLRGEWKELLAFGTDALKANPANDDLAGYLIQAARFDKTIDDPLALVPDQVKKSATVMLSRVDFLRHRGRIADWWQAAREVVTAYPDDRHAQQFAAEADLDEILSDPHYQKTALFQPGERSKIVAAADVLQRYWDKACAGEGAIRPEHLALCSNLIVAFHALGDFPKAIAIARQGLDRAPEDRELTTRAAFAAVDGHDEAIVRELLPRLPPDPSTAILKFRFHAQRGEWAEVVELWRADGALIPACERVMVTATGRLAEIILNPGEDIAASLMAVVKDVADDSRASIVAANFAIKAGYDTIGDEAYQNALRNINDESQISGRLMVAMHAAKRGDWGSVADLLDDHIDEEHDSEELRALSTALINESPIRKRSIRFIERLPDAIRGLPFYLHTAGLIHFNRGALNAAEISLRQAIAAEPNLSSYLALFATLRRKDQEGKIAPMLQSLDLVSLEGAPGQKMHLAQELCAIGQNGAALSYAYGVLRQAPNDPDAAFGYFSLLMSDPTGLMIPSMPTVDLNAWVRLEGDGNERFEFIIEEGADRPANGILSPTHPMVVAVLGLKVDATFELQHGFGSKTTWRVAEVKHKYLHALHDVMENFQTRFPDAKGLYRFTAKDGDIQPILDQVKKAAEMNRKFADFYLLQHSPMAMVASQLGKGSVGFAEYIRGLDEDIKTCIGIGAERLAAQNLLLQHRASGVVLDTYTAWTVATMDVLDILLAVFGKVVVPQSVIDELRNLNEGRFSERTSMTIGWHNGQFIRQELTKEEIEAHSRFIGDQIQKIKHNCQVESVAAPDSLTKLATRLTQAFGPYVLDAANLAAEGHILLSEDMYFRQYANVAVPVKGIWLQAVLTFARDNELITRERYADAIVQLAFRRHSYLSLDAGTLWDVFLADTSNLDQFRTVAKFIGTKDADIRSHISVATVFLREIWRTKYSLESKGKRATGVLLGCLIRHRFDDWESVLALIKVGADQHLKGYIDDWVQGHFLPMDRLKEAERIMAHFIMRHVYHP
jgi:tetratricopeptide (TPR) repeat protein